MAISEQTIIFSILIPVYNVEPYLRECLDSVMHQSYAKYEVIMIDDGSTDKSGEICEEYAARDKRFLVYHQENQGLMQTRKAGVQKAQGDYCLFLDSDDTYEPQLLQTVFEFLKKKACDVVVFNKYIWYVDKKRKVENLTETDEIVDGKCAVGKMLCKSQFFSIFIKVVRREMILEYLEQIYIPVNYAEDVLQTVHFFALANTVGITNKYLYNYRIRKGSLIHRSSVEKIREILGVANRILDTLKNYHYDDMECINEYRTFVLNDFMENIFKLNNTEKSRKQHYMDLENLYAVEEWKTFLNMEYRIKLYNRIRLQIFRRKQYGVLLFIDHILQKIQNIQNKWRKETPFL